MSTSPSSEVAGQRPPVRVIYFITELSVGGAQVALYNLVSGLDQKKYAQSVVCLYNGDKLIGQKIASLGIPVIDLGMRHKLRLDAFWRLYRLLRKNQPDILYTWMFHANIPGRVIGRLGGVRTIVSSEHTMGQEGLTRRWLDRMTSRFADRIICVSQGIANFGSKVIGFPPEKLVVIPNGIDLEIYTSLPSQAQARARYNLPEKDILIGAVGRPRPVKGYAVLLKAFFQISEVHPQAHLVFVGEGPDKMQLAKQAAQAGLAESVTFLGDQENIPGLLPALDILAMPSLHEGLGIVALEAMAAGLPVVGTRVGGIPEAVIDGVTGYLVPPSDASALSEALLRLIEDQILRQQLGEAGRKYVYEHFSEGDVRKKTEDLFAELLLRH